MLSKTNVILLAEHYNGYMRLYYADGHFECSKKGIKLYSFENNQERSYKKPIQVHSTLLHPTMSNKEQNCRWINLEFLEARSEFYIHLLVQRNLYHKAIRMYLRLKEKELTKEVSI